MVLASFDAQKDGVGKVLAEGIWESQTGEANCSARCPSFPAILRLIVPEAPGKTFRADNSCRLVLSALRVAEPDSAWHPSTAAGCISVLLFPHPRLTEPAASSTCISWPLHVDMAYPIPPGNRISIPNARGIHLCDGSSIGNHILTRTWRIYTCLEHGLFRNH
ncbi:hypothetical protein BC834DRAFT_892579 [Gloeopeniophorella convolvens]|nr:hypothetical protein BC834DRAFT_892579 [Gloeopeniophorella convolvens]